MYVYMYIYIYTHMPIYDWLASLSFSLLLVAEHGAAKPPLGALDASAADRWGQH